MGASSSTDQKPSQEQQEEESLASSTGSLPTLRAAFSNLANPNSNTIPLSSLQDAFSLHFKNLTSESPSTVDLLTRLLPHLGPSIVSQFFATTENEASWIDFLRGFNRCCARMPASSSLNALFRLYFMACKSADIPCKLEFEADVDEGKIEGCLTPSDLHMLLLVCWIMVRPSKGGGDDDVVLPLPDLSHLVLSACVSGGVVGEEKAWQFDATGTGMSVSAQKIQMWVITTVPGIANCFSQFVQERLKACAASKDEMNVLSSGDRPMPGKHLLTCGSAWAISLTLRKTLGEELLSACFPVNFGESPDNLLYRSSIHGKGLSRFWSQVEGYHGPSLILLSAISEEFCESDGITREWVIGIVTEQEFENRDTFYGNSGYLYAISPIFRVLPPSGKDKNFVYCHLHPTLRAYEREPKPVGLAFGGSLGNERIFIDEDFARVIIRNHAYDKTYQPGSLIPSQGFLHVEASLVEIEVWGLGGKAAKEKQSSHKKRQDLFSEQRRKVDLKTFGNWEDSPEKMMMDMVTDPNRVRREDR